MSALSVRYHVATSIDGFIASPDGSVAWLEPYPPEAGWFEDFLVGFSGLVLGRATFDKLLELGAWPYGDLPGAVVSSRPLPASSPSSVELVASPRAALASLSRRGVQGEVWLVGGGKLASAFLEEGLLDTVDFVTVPVCLGEGIPAFAPLPRPHHLRVVERDALTEALVRTLYEPAEGGAAPAPEPMD